MNVQIRSKEIKVNDATKDRIEAGVNDFEKFSLPITSTEVIITKVKNTVGVEYKILIAKQAPVIVNENNEQLEVAVEKASKKAMEVLGRLHEKVVNHNASSIKDMEPLEN